jgi:hypothetical protein
MGRFILETLVFLGWLALMFEGGRWLWRKLRDDRKP